MKKILLMLVAVTATMTAFANAAENGWKKSFSPVAKQADLAGVHTAVAADGSVYASSTYDQAFTVGNASLAAPEDNMLSSCIIKFDKNGNGLWAVSLVGACTINAMAVDTDGTLYIAGRSEDEKIVITDTQNNKKEIENPKRLNPFFEEFVSANAGFIAKFDGEGVLKAIKTITPEVSADILAILGDPYEMGMEGSVYDYSFNDPVYLLPKKIVLDGDKVYVAAGFTGDIVELGWNGRYLNYYGMDETVLDVKSCGVFSLDKNLENLASVASVSATERVQMMSQYYPETIDFVVYGGVPHVAFIGGGELTLTTSAGSKNFAFDVTEDGLNHALVLASVNAPDQPKVFNAAPNDYLGAKFELVDATLADGNCILAGTFYGNFPLDNTITKGKNTSFVASIKMSDCSVNWAMANEVESKAKCMIVTGEEIHAAANEVQKGIVEEKEVEEEIGMHYVFKTADGTLKKTEEQGFEDADSYNDQYVSTIFITDEEKDDAGVITKPAQVVVFCPHMNPSGINETKALKNGAAKIYNLNGVEMSAPQKGLNIVKTADGVKKVTVK